MHGSSGRVQCLHQGLAQLHVARRNCNICGQHSSIIFRAWRDFSIWQNQIPVQHRAALPVWFQAMVPVLSDNRLSFAVYCVYARDTQEVSWMSSVSDGDRINGADDCKCDVDYDVDGGDSCRMMLKSVVMAVVMMIMVTMTPLVVRSAIAFASASVSSLAFASAFGFAFACAFASPFVSASASALTLRPARSPLPRTPLPSRPPRNRGLSGNVVFVFKSLF
jgi:hypothetical protein